MKPNISVEELRKNISYDPDTGTLRWLVRRGKAQAGQVAGCIDGQKYRVVAINGKLYQAHRMCWALHYGEWPPGDIDHRDLCKDNNRIRNLRIATPSQNHANVALTSKNTSGKKGVCWSKATARWQASIKVEGRNVYLGQFDSVDEAHAAYCAAAKTAWPEFMRTA